MPCIGKSMMSVTIDSNHSRQTTELYGVPTNDHALGVQMVAEHEPANLDDLRPQYRVAAL